MESTTDAEQVGAEVQAGLPNITGHFGAQGFTDNGFVSGGALYQYKMSIKTSQSYNSKQTHQLGFDASRSNAIYGGSDTVQPHSIKVFRWIRVAVEPVEEEE